MASFEEDQKSEVEEDLSYVNTTNADGNFNSIDEEDRDQNEDELALMQPKIELDMSAQVDRDDDPTFEDDEILTLLNNNQEEEKPQPMSLADYSIEAVTMPSEIDEKRQTAKYFKGLILQNYGLSLA